MEVLELIAINYFTNLSTNVRRQLWRQHTGTWTPRTRTPWASQQSPQQQPRVHQPEPMGPANWMDTFARRLL